MVEVVCRDCETPRDIQLSGLCLSCQQHRNDGHKPTQYSYVFIDVNGHKHLTWWYCHGAGPFGTNFERLEWGDVTVGFDR